MTLNNWILRSSGPYSYSGFNLPKDLLKYKKALFTIHLSRRGICGYYSLLFFRSQVVIKKSSNDTFFFFQKVVLGENIIIWVKYGNVFTS